MKKFFILLFCILISQLAGIIGSIFTIPNINDWYNLLSKPAFTPPSWLFGPAWIVLYLLMGFALYLIIVTDIKKNFFDRIIDFVLRIKDDDKSAAYSFFAIQLILNSLWSILFFGLHNPCDSWRCARPQNFKKIFPPCGRSRRRCTGTHPLAQHLPRPHHGTNCFRPVPFCKTFSRPRNRPCSPRRRSATGTRSFF